MNICKIVKKIDQLEEYRSVDKTGWKKAFVSVDNKNTLRTKTEMPNSEIQKMADFLFS